jgi:stage IV sporulation protein A
MRYLASEYERDPLSVWKTNMFGKTLKELCDDGFAEKNAHMPKETRKKFAETIERVINEGAGGMICILL